MDEQRKREVMQANLDNLAAAREKARLAGDLTEYYRLNVECWNAYVALHRPAYVR